MTSRDFVFWLQGFFEITEGANNNTPEIKRQPLTLNEAQVQMIKNHLNLVFKHEIDPSYSPDPKVQLEMQKIHDDKIHSANLNWGKDTLLRC